MHVRVGEVVAAGIDRSRCGPLLGLMGFDQVLFDWVFQSLPAACLPADQSIAARRGGFEAGLR